jgi:hypothetical protein
MFAALQSVRAEDDRRPRPNTLGTLQGGNTFVAIGFFFLHFVPSYDLIWGIVIQYTAIISQKMLKVNQSKKAEQPSLPRLFRILTWSPLPDTLDRFLKSSL